MENQSSQLELKSVIEHVYSRAFRVPHTRKDTLLKELKQKVTLGYLGKYFDQVPHLLYQMQIILLDQYRTSERLTHAWFENLIQYQKFQG